MARTIIAPKYAVLTSNIAHTANSALAGRIRARQARLTSSGLHKNFPARRQAAAYTLIATSARMVLVNTMGRPAMGDSPIIPSQFNVFAIQGIEAREG